MLIEIAEYADITDVANIGLFKYINDAKLKEQKVIVYAELTPKERLFMLECTSPTAQYSAVLKSPNDATSTISRLYFMELQSKLPDNVELRYCDIRDSYPFAALNLMHKHLQNKMAHISPMLKAKYMDPEQRVNFIISKVRQLENAITEHLRNSEETANFWMSLVSPDIQLPEWYMDIVSSIFGVQENLLKVLLKCMQKEDPVYYKLLMDLYLEVSQRFIGHYETESTFSMLYLMQDIYMIANYIGSYKNAHHVFLSQSTTPFIKKYLQAKEKIGRNA